MAKRLGSGTLLLENSPSVLSFGAVGTKKEGEGPLGNALDRLWEDSMLGEDTWEKAECRLQKEAVGIALEKGGFTPEDLGPHAGIAQQYLFHYSRTHPELFA